MKLYIRLLLLISISVWSCSTTKQTTAFTKDAQGNLVGVVQKSAFQQAPYSTWFTENYDTYKPDGEVVQAIKPLLKDIKIKAFMGTWCGDSRRETPHFYKILEAAGFNLKNLTMVCVDRSRTSPSNEQEGMNIERVPTFIFYKDGKEINRFVEFPRETLEKDILKILQEKGYKHSYLD